MSLFEVKTCPPLKDTKEATVTLISRECKAVATYTCKNKLLIMLGSGEKICNTSGMWEGAEPQCNFRKCVYNNLFILFYSFHSNYTSNQLTVFTLRNVDNNIGLGTFNPPSQHDSVIYTI